MFQRVGAALLALVGVTLVAMGGYVLVSGNGGPAWLPGNGEPTDKAAGSDTPLLAHVPAEAVLFSGYTADSLPITDLTTAWGELSDAGGSDDLPSPATAAENDGAAAGMLTGMYRAYLEDFHDGKTLLDSFGRAPGGAVGVYTVGSLPVMRVDLADKQRFWQRIDRIEADAGIKPKATDGSAARSRRYAFKTDADNTEVSLLVATHRGDAVVTVTGAAVPSDAIALALGETMPERSLADSGKLERLAKRYGTQAGATGFIDHEALIGGLTGASESRFARMLAHVDPQGSETASELFTNKACREDARAIAAMWPHTVFGITEVDSDAQRVGGRLALGIDDDQVLKALTQMRGRIPEPTSKETVLDLGLGLRLQNVAMSVQQLSDRFTGADFGCPRLKRSQQRLTNQGLGRLEMVTRMVGDIRGVGLAVMALKPGSGMSPVGGDAIVEIATPDPESLWRTANSMIGLKAENQPEPGGSAVAVSGLGAPGVPTLRVALRDNALVVLVGDAQLDHAAGETELEANGMMRLRYSGPALGQAIQDSGVSRRAGSEAQQALASVRGTNLRYDMSLDIASNGIHFDSVIDVTSSQ